MRESDWSFDKHDDDRFFRTLNERNRSRRNYLDQVKEKAGVAYEGVK